MLETPAIVTLETARLRLQTPRVADAGRMLEYFDRNRDHLAPYAPKRPPDFYTEEHWQDRLALYEREEARGRGIRFMILERRGRSVIGDCAFTSIERGAAHACNLGYSIDAEHEGRGLMVEALEAATTHVLDEIGLHRINAAYVPDNHRSARLLQRVGFVVEGYAQSYLFVGGAWRDHVLTSLRRVTAGRSYGTT